MAMIFLALLFSITTLHAEIMGARSIEWLACDAEVIAVGYLKEVRESKGPGEVIYEDCVLVVTELLKPSLQKNEVSFTFIRFNHDPSMAVWMHDGAQLLVFLSTSKDHGPEKRLDGVLVPTSKSFPLSLVDLSKPGKYLIDTKFNVLESGREVLEAARDGLQALNDYQLTKGSKKSGEGAHGSALQRSSVQGIVRGQHLLFRCA